MDDGSPGGACPRSSHPGGDGPPGPPPAIVALLTPPGRGALAVVGIRGEGATCRVEGAFRPRGPAVAAWPIGRVGLGTWRGRGAADLTPEDVVAVRTADGWEIHCHGGVAAPAAILDDLRATGASVVGAADWCAVGEDASVDDAIPLFSRVRGPRAARILSRQHAGLLSRAFAELETLVARGDRGRAEALAARLLAAGRIGLRLDRPWRVVLSGRVNAGKSSLVNALAGHARSIVSAEPGTTRDAVETALVLGGWEVVLVDTAGTPEGTGRRPGPVERAGIERADRERRDADLVIEVGEAGTPPPPGEGLVVWSKADLVGACVAPPGVVVTSATTGAGIEDLSAAIERRLLPELAGDPTLLDGPVPFLPRHLDRVRALLAAVTATPATEDAAGGSGRRSPPP